MKKRFFLSLVTLVVTITAIGGCSTQEPQSESSEFTIWENPRIDQPNDKDDGAGKFNPEPLERVDYPVGEATPAPEAEYIMDEDWFRGIADVNPVDSMYYTVTLGSNSSQVYDSYRLNRPIMRESMIFRAPVKQVMVTPFGQAVGDERIIFLLENGQVYIVPIYESLRSSVLITGKSLTDIDSIAAVNVGGANVCAYGKDGSETLVYTGFRA